jgi:hypothetical protein
MILRFGTRTWRGTAIDLTDRPLEPDAVVDAVRASTVPSEALGRTSTLAISCPAPTPLHEFVGHVGPTTSLQIRPALAAAARSRGLEAPQDDQLESLREELGGIEPPAVSIADARRRLAEATGQTQALRERMATLRGRLQERTARDGDPADIRDELETTAARLSEVETERAAAEQRLERAQARRREANAVRDRRLELEDRIGNLERDARATLVERMRERYETALRRVPGSPDVGDPFEVPPAVAALAIARIGQPAAPIVYDGDRFETATGLAVWLGTPVVLC